MARASDKKQILAMIKAIDLQRSPEVLDVGTGYGDMLELLNEEKFKTTGVEINSMMVNYCRGKGLNCLTPKEFEETSTIYDIIIMSQVIEHFSPSSLFQFIDGYLDRLHMEGFLLIATPLMSPNFYDDFDHVRPYTPQAIYQAFVAEKPKIKYISRNRLKTFKIQRGKSRLRPSESHALYLMQHPLIAKCEDRVASLLFRVSGGVIGRTDTWFGLFRKKA